MAYPTSDSAYKRVSHLYASVDECSASGRAAAESVCGPRHRTSWSRWHRAGGRQGDGLIAVLERGGGGEGQGAGKSRPRCDDSPDVKGLDDDGFPVEGFWPTLDLSPNPATSGIFVGELSVGTRTLPSRIVVTPANQYPQVQAASLLGVDADPLDAVGLHVELYCFRRHRRRSAGIGDGPRLRDHGGRLRRRRCVGRVRAVRRGPRCHGSPHVTQTVDMAKPDSTPAPVGIEFTIFRADRYEEPTSLACRRLGRAAVPRTRSPYERFGAGVSAREGPNSPSRDGAIPRISPSLCRKAQAHCPDGRRLADQLIR